MDMEYSLVNNWIVVTLNNINQTTATTVTLFKSPANSASASAVSPGQYVTGVTSLDFPSTFKVFYSKNGAATQNQTSGVLTTPQELVDFINLIFESVDPPACYYTEPLANKYDFYSFSSIYELVDIEGNVSGSNPATDMGLNVIQGSFANVDVESSDLTYDELVSELQYQPYKLLSANVYANSIDQVNQTFLVNNREATGHVNLDLKTPGLSPMFRQFVQQNIMLNFSPSSTNLLKYTLGPAETVRLIFPYHHQELLTIPDKTIFVPKTEIPELEQIIVKERTHDVPMLELVKAHNKEPNGHFLKKVIEPFIPKRRVQKEEVYSAFNGYDYKEKDQ